MKKKKSQTALTMIGLLLFSAATISTANAAPDSSAATNQSNQSQKWWSNQPLKSWPETHLSKNHLLGMYRAKAMTGGKKLLPMHPEKKRYLKLKSGQVATRNDVHTWTIKKGSNAPYRLEGGDKRIQHFAVDSRGNIVLTAVEDPNRGDLIEFSPPMMRVPAHLIPGKKYVTKSKLKVVKMNNHKHKVTHGTVIDTLEYVAQAKVKTPGGTFQCVYIKDHSVSNLTLAKVTTDSHRFIAPGIGEVAEYYHEHVRAVWIIHWNHRSTTLLEK